MGEEPIEECQFFACHEASEPCSLELYMGEGDESPRTIDGVWLCDGHREWIEQLGFIGLGAVRVAAQ